MQTCKFISAIGVAALLAGVTTSTFADTEEQARAREALRQKMAELDAQASSKAVKPAPVTPPKSVPAPPPVVVAPPVTPPPVAPPTPPPAPVPVVKVTPPPVPVVTPPAAVPPADPEAIDRARVALREKMSQLDAQPGVSPSAPVVRAASKPAVRVSPSVTSVAPVVTPPPVALQPPPSPLPAGKEAALAELLRQYKADTITPEQYHTQRAAIIKAEN